MFRDTAWVLLWGCRPRVIGGMASSRETCENLVLQGGGAFECIPGRGIRDVFGPRGTWRHVHTCTGFSGLFHRHVMRRDV